MARQAAAALMALLVPDAARCACLDYRDFFHWAGEVDTPGIAWDVAVSGDYAYVVDEASDVADPGLHVIDISNPAAPLPIASLTTPAVPSGVAVQEDYVFVAHRGAVAAPRGMWVFDVTDPTSPLLVGSVTLPSSFATDVAVAGTRAYVAAASLGLFVVDITDPTQPQILGTVDTPGFAARVVVEGDYAYIADGTSNNTTGLLVVDVHDAASPQIVGSVHTPGGAAHVAVAGHFAYLGAGINGLHVVDVSDPHAPVLVAARISTEGTYGLAVRDGFLFVAAGSHVDGPAGLAILDIHNAASPTLVGFSLASGPAWNVALGETGAYVAADELGLLSFDVANPKSVTSLGTVATPRGSGCVAARGAYAFATDITGVKVVDIRDPESPRVVADAGIPATDLALAGAHLYASGSTFRILDVADPLSPHVVGSVVTPEWTSHLAVLDGLVCAQEGSSALRLIDVHEPASPALLGIVNMPNGALYDLAAHGGFAYAGDNGALRVVDLADPSIPQFVASVPIPLGPRGIAIAGSTVCAVAGATLYLVDVAEPTLPVLVSTMQMQNACQDVAVAGDLAYVSYYGRGVGIIDISDALSPWVVGEAWALEGRPAGLAPLQDIVVVASDNRLAIYPAHCRYPVGTGLPRFETRPSPATTLRLEPVAPNPAMHAVRLAFSLPVPSRSEVAVFDVAGRRVAVLQSGESPAGRTRLSWSGRDEDGRPAAGGIYFVRLRAGAETRSRSFTLLR